MIAKKLNLLVMSATAAIAVTLVGGCGAYAHGPRHYHAIPKHHDPKSMDEHFTQGDANGDGEITMEEAMAWGEDRLRRRMERMFQRLDTDENGTISQEEFELGHMPWRHHRSHRRHRHHRPEASSDS